MALYKRVLSSFLITAFVLSSLSIPRAFAGELVMAPMPVPGSMVDLSPMFIAPHLQGITIHPDNALQFDFLIHKGDPGGIMLLREKGVSAMVIACLNKGGEETSPYWLSNINFFWMTLDTF